jgi:prepilin-type processing-associated H-X9-DG protein
VGNDPDRQATPERATLNHNRKANVGFVDTHVELMGEPQLRRESLWHPIRLPGFWSGLRLDLD